MGRSEVHELNESEDFPSNLAAKEPLTGFL